MPQISYLPKSFPLDSGSNLMAGAKAYWYITLTTTPKDTYTDYALSVANTNPVVADGNGIFPTTFLKNDVRYRLTLKTSADVLIYTQDDIGGPVITQAELGAILYPRTAAELAAGVTPTNYAYAPVGQSNSDMNRYAAVGGGDGVTPQTTAFSNALSIISGAIINVCRTTASWLVGAVNLAIPGVIQGAGKITLSGANAGFKLNANMAGMVFQDIEVAGDGVIGNLHRMVWNDLSKTISGLRINGVYVHNCIQNVDASQVTDSVIFGNRIDLAQGSSSGQGYGIVATKSQRTAFFGNTFSNNGRHSIYNSGVTYNTIVGNISHQNIGPNSLSAFAISRVSTGVAVIGNIAAEYVGIGMTIDGDNLDGAGTERAIQVVGNVFYQLPASTNINPDMAIGSSSPATTPLQSISVRNNSFTPSSVRQNGFIAVTNGFNLDISDNVFDAYLGTVAAYIGINLDTAAGGAYYDRIRICGNTGIIASSGGGTTFLNVGTNICTGTQQLDVFNNTVTCGVLINYATTPTNPNIRTDSVQEQAIVLVNGAQNLNIAGYNRFYITAAAGATVTNITNGYEGKEITLLFGDANTTLTRGNQYLGGSVNFVSANRAVMKLVYRQSSWYELSRSLNG